MIHLTDIMKTNLCIKDTLNKPRLLVVQCFLKYDRIKLSAKMNERIMV